jgi:hypothetical protein
MRHFKLHRFPNQRWKALGAEFSELTISRAASSRVPVFVKPRDCKLKGSFIT